jgi:hypothetical protein
MELLSGRLRRRQGAVPAEVQQQHPDPISQYTSTNDTFTDHLGVDREVHARNDITVNRSMFILGGYIFDPRLRYSSTVWTSAGAASIIVAGNIGWQFNKALTLTGGYTGVPGSRSLVNTFPFFTSTDRTMADNFFRPASRRGCGPTESPWMGCITRRSWVMVSIP